MAQPVIAIDPGPTESAFVDYDGKQIRQFGKATNDGLRRYLKTHPLDRVVVEMIAHYGTGMPAGVEVFETCVWIGRFTEVAGAERVHRLMRATVKAHICGSAKAKDGNVRQALIDRWGGREKAIGKKKTPGPLYGVSGDVWSALAVAVTWIDKQERA